MSHGRFDYTAYMHGAFRRVVAEILTEVAQKGLVGDHHFYITFRTDHRGVVLPDWLREQYPQTLTVILQHEYDELAVLPDRFSVKLTFRDRPATLVIPYAALCEFVDPSAKFGFAFPQDGDAEEIELDEETPEPTPETASEGGESESQVVSLDAFRKK